MRFKIVSSGSTVIVNSAIVLLGTSMVKTAQIWVTVNQLIFAAINFCGFVFIGIFAAIIFKE